MCFLRGREREWRRTERGDKEREREWGRERMENEKEGEEGETIRG